MEPDKPRQPPDKPTANVKSSETLLDSKHLFSYLISHGEECRLDISSVVNHLKTSTADKSYDEKKMLELVNSSPENFEVEIVDGKQFIEAKSTLKLCEMYQNPVGYCWATPCKDLHICRHFLRGSADCLAGDECKQPHGFDNPKTRVLLVQHKLDNLSPDNLITLYRKVSKERKYKVRGSSTSTLSASIVHNNGDSDFISDSNPKEAKPKAVKRNSPIQATRNLPTAVASSHLGCAATVASENNANNSSPNDLKGLFQNTLREYPKEHAPSTTGPILAVPASSAGRSIAAMRSRLTEAMFSHLVSHGNECCLDIFSVVKHLRTFTGNKGYDQIKVLDLVNTSENFEVNTVGGKLFVEAKSSLKLCEVFQKGECNDDSCKGLHICPSFLENNCQFGDECKKPHGFDSPRATALLVDCKLDTLSPDGLKTLFQNTSRKNSEVEVSSISSSILDDTASSGKPTSSKRSNTDAIFSCLISHGEKCCLDIPSVVKHLKTLTGDESYNRRKVFQFVNSSPEKFKVKTVDGKQFVKAKSSLKLCNLFQAGKCNVRPSCKSLHICCHFLKGTCSSADKCKMPHGFDDPETRALLAEHKLDNLSPDDLITLFRKVSGPILGDSASSGKSKIAKRSRLTEAMFLNLISNGDECRLDIASVVKHLQAFGGDESYDQRTVLELVNRSHTKKFEVETVDGKQFVKAKSSLKLCELYQDPELWCWTSPCRRLHICPRFLKGKCWVGDKCEMPHGFDSAETRALLVHHKLDKLSPDELIIFFRKLFRERKYKVSRSSGPATRSNLTDALFSYLVTHGNACRLDITSVVKRLQKLTVDESYDQTKAWELVNTSPEKFEVKTIIGKQFVEAKSSLKLCEQYQEGNCMARECQGLHICRHSLIGSCWAGEKCKRPHGFHNPKTRALLVEHKLDSLSPDALLTLFRKVLKERKYNVQASATFGAVKQSPTEVIFSYLIQHGEECSLDMPRVVKGLQMFGADEVLRVVNSSPKIFECKTVDGKQFVEAKSSLKLCDQFQEGKCWVRPCVKGLHICRRYLLGKCLSSAICKMPHGFGHPETRALLKQHKLNNFPPYALKSLFRNTLKERRCNVHAMYTPAEALFSYLISHCEECRLDIPSVVKFVHKFSGSNSYDQKKVLKLLNASPQQFEVKTIDGIQFVEAKSSLNLCEVFQAKGKCRDYSCKGLHICPFFLEDNCQFGDKCKMPHGFDNRRARALLVYHKLEDLPSDALITLFRKVFKERKYKASSTSSPSTRRVYNNGDYNLASRDEQRNSMTQATPNLPTAASSHVESVATVASVNVLNTHMDDDQVDQQNDRFQTKRDVRNRRRSAKYLKYLDEKTMKEGLEE